MDHPKSLIRIQWICVGMLASGLSAQPWRFLVTCDSRGDVFGGINEQVLSELSDEILRSDVDLVVFPGDLVYGARVGPEWFERQLWNWVDAMRPVYDAGIPVYVGRGNHEVGDMWDALPGEMPDPADNYAIRWLHVFGSDSHPESRLPDNGPAGEKHMTYSVAHRNALFISLDQYAGTRHYPAHTLNQSWLSSELANRTVPHVFVFGHEPAFKALHPDCLDDYPARRDTFWRSLRAAGARVYFCGHDHFYDHARVDDGDGNPENDIHQFIIGSAGAYPYTWTPPYDGENGAFTVSQIHHADRYGYVVVDVNDLDVTLTWMERDTNDLRQPGLYKPAETWTYTARAGLTDCPTRPAADLNGDCRVDGADLAILASQWLADGRPPDPPADSTE